MREAQTEIMLEEDLQRAEERSLHRSQPPADVPGYQPKRLLGKGAFGEVWLAENRNTGCLAAIKFYARRGGLDWDLLGREVEKLRFLDTDPHVVRLHEVGWKSDPPYYVMEYLEESLEDRLRRGPLPVAQAVEMFRELAVGLSHAHAKGILHCDLKPANILLGQDGKPRLADFGQSRQFSDQAPALGTLFYMAPEQADLRAAPDARWDVYALGVILYRMLTGQLPHHARERPSDIQQAGTLEQRLERYRRFIRESPSPTAHRMVPGTDRRLARIVEGCLAAEPRKRFANVQAVLTALNNRALSRARRPLLILGGVLPVVALLVIALFRWQEMNRAVEESRHALVQQELRNNQYDAHHTAQMFAFQIDRNWRVLEKTADDQLLCRSLEAINQGLDEEIKRAGERPQPDKERQANLRKWLRGSIEHQKIQEWMEKSRQENEQVARERYWSLFSRQGILLAAVPNDERVQESLGADRSFRDFFHGQDGDEQRGQPPTTKVHLSRPFISQVDQAWTVGFSVPVREESNKDVLGVLMMTVKLQDFHVAAGGQEQIIIFDTRPSKELKNPGTIIHYPNIKQDTISFQMSPDVVKLTKQWETIKESMLRKREEDPAAGPFIIEPSYGKTASQLNDELAELIAGRELVNCEKGLSIQNYRDPIAGDDAEQLGVVDAVIVRRKKYDYVDTGWGIVVQERLKEVVAPVASLQAKLTRQSLMAFVLIIGVGVAAWGFVLLLQTESSRSRLSRFLRRRAGLAPASGSSSIGSSRHSGSSGPSGARMPASGSGTGAGAGANA